MIGKCDQCGTEVTRYGGPDVMRAACEKCGSFIFWCLHWGVNEFGLFDPSKNRWTKLNLQTYETLDDQPEYNLPWMR